MTFKIHTPPCILFAATILCQQLNRLGHSATICNEIEQDNCIYIIYNASGYTGQLPRKYIVYQTEFKHSHWFNLRYLEIIRGAICVWEYSENNIRAYAKQNDRIAIVTPGIAPQPIKPKDIDITFYGYLKGSGRRQLLLSKYSRTHNINAITDKTGAEMWDILSRSKVVLNLHYYDTAPLEIFRVNEALSHRCHVVSEPPFAEKYLPYVHFFRSERELNTVLQKCFEREFNYDITPLDNLSEVSEAVKLIG